MWSGSRRILVAQYPWLPGTIYKAFCQAKKLAIRELKEMAATRMTVPWPEATVQDAEALMGQDYWRYGVTECEHEITTLARYSYEQGLAARELRPDEIFHPSVFETSKV